MQLLTVARGANILGKADMEKLLSCVGIDRR